MPKGKFAGLRAELEKAKQGTTSRPDRIDGKGRAPGKRSNPAWKQHTVMLEKETHLVALDILRRQDNGQDISDLLNQLLADWVKQHRTAV
jgi:hypothetical protein